MSEHMAKIAARTSPPTSAAASTEHVRSTSSAPSASSTPATPASHQDRPRPRRRQAHPRHGRPPGALGQGRLRAGLPGRPQARIAGRVMSAPVYTTGSWRPFPGHEDAFLDAWQEFANWSCHLPEHSSRCSHATYATPTDSSASSAGTASTPSAPGSHRPSSSRTWPASKSTSTSSHRPRPRSSPRLAQTLPQAARASDTAEGWDAGSACKVGSAPTSIAARTCQM